MKKMFCLFLLFSFHFVCFKTFGQTSKSNYNIIEYAKNYSKDFYAGYLDSVQNGMASDYLKLRLSYSQTEEFSPYRIDINELHKNTYTNLEKNDFTSAALLMDSALSLNYVDLKSHMICGYIYKMLNNTIKSTYHKNLYDNLLTTILETGDGQTQETAFIVINVDEEKEVLEAYGLKQLEQSIKSNEKYIFDLIKAKDEETDEEYDIYFNINLFYGKFK